MDCIGGVEEHQFKLRASRLDQNIFSNGSRFVFRPVDTLRIRRSHTHRNSASRTTIVRRAIVVQISPLEVNFVGSLCIG
ncbi:hypothetical protein [Bradyrhizobium sp.]|uniref:hypothetical protein n=1 Tax=Bradyrhizobium sp. TaxID=376 RepID=UPI00238D05D3|nr:hypothetical protein [Bradyrhizobium sp.]MDE2380048.1 hypothetical protein [Bradyrhizobium sp.]